MRTLPSARAEFYALENADAQLESMQNYFSDSWTQAQKAAYGALYGQIDQHDVIKAPEPENAVSTRFKHVRIAMGDALDMAGISLEELETAHRALEECIGEEDAWHMDDVSNMLFHVAYHSYTENTPISLDELVETYEDHDGADEVEVVDAAEGEINPYSNAKDFAEHYAGLWLALRAGKHLVDNGEYAQFYNQHVPEGMQANDPHHEAIDKALAAVGEGFGNEDLREESYDILRNSSNSDTELAVLHLMDMIHTRELRTPMTAHTRRMVAKDHEHRLANEELKAAALVEDELTRVLDELNHEKAANQQHEHTIAGQEKFIQIQDMVLKNLSNKLDGFEDTLGTLHASLVRTREQRIDKVKAGFYVAGAALLSGAGTYTVTRRTSGLRCSSLKRSVRI